MTIRTTLLYMTLYIFTLNSAFADEFSKSQIPNWVKLTALPSSQSSSSDTQGTDKFLLVDHQFNFLGKRQSRFYRFAQKILNESQLQQASQISVDFDPSYQTVSLHRLTIHRDNKQINKLSTTKVSLIRREKDLENSIFDGRKTATLILEDVRMSDIVEYAYTIEGSNPVFNNKNFGGFETQWGVPVKQVSYKLLVNSSEKLFFKSHYSDSSFVKTVTPKHTLYEYKATDVPALYRDKNTPSWFDPYPWIQFSSYRHWNELVNWALPLYQKPDNPTQTNYHALLDIGHELYQEQKIVKALDFVQDKIRYTGIEVGIGSYKPNKPDLVLSRRFGDCKDKVLLFISILNSWGIKAEPVLVNTKRTKDLENFLPSPTIFNHVIARVEYDGSVYWLDPTMSGQEGSLNQIFQPSYGFGLVIHDKNTTLHKINTPIDQRLNKEIFETFDVRPTGEASLYAIDTIYYNADADSSRSFFQQNNIDNITRDYQNYFAKFYPQLEIHEPVRITDDKPNNAFTVHERYRIPALWTFIDSRKRFEADFIQSDLHDTIKLPQHTKRTMPLYIGAERELRVHTNIKLPEPWPIENHELEIKDDSFKFTKIVKKNGNEISIDYHFVTFTDAIAASAVDLYSKNISRARDSIGYYLYMNDPNSKNEQKQVFANLNWTFILVLIMALMIAIIVCHKIYKYDPAPSIDQQNSNLTGFGGWLILPTLGLILSPFRLLNDLSDYTKFFQNDLWLTLTTPGSDAYNVLWAPFILLEVVANTFSFVFLLLVIILFFNKRSSAPMMYIALVLSGIIIQFSDYYFGMQIPAIKAEIKSAEFAQLTTAAGVSLLWVIYFLVSRRVKMTFTKRHRTTHDQTFDSESATDQPAPVIHEIKNLPDDKP